MYSEVTMKYIKELIKKYKYTAFALVVAVTVCNITSLFYNYSFKFVIDAVEQKNVSEAWKSFAVLLGFQILVTVLTLLIYDYYLRIFQKDVERDVRNDIMSEILTWPFSKSKEITLGSLSTLMTSDATQIGQYVSLYYFMIIANSIRFVITAYMLFTLDIVVGMIVILSIPLYYILTEFTMAPMQKYVKESYEARDKLNNSFLDVLNNLMNIKSYKIEKISDSIIRAKTKELYLKEKGFQKWIAVFYFIRNFLSSFMPVIIVGFSIIRIISGDMTIGTLIALNGLLGAMYLPIDEIFYFKSMKNNLEPVIDRINPIIESQIDKEDKREVKFGQPEVTVENLSYSYGENSLIKNISFKLEGPGLYRFSGHNGKGKSTLFNIISGLYNDFDGEVQLNISEELPNIAYMNQKNILYDASLNDNITLFGKNDISELGLKTLDKFKDRSEEKGDFSGGEKRWILFLQTISCKASIYLFDEPFEGVDKNTKTQMKDIITKLSENNLVLIISHEDKDFEKLKHKEIYL